MTAAEFEERLTCDWPVAAWKDVTILVAVSGGADSVALLCALAAVKRSAGGAGCLRAAHFNHRLRGEASDADEAFVQGLCRKLGVALHLGHGQPDTLRSLGGDGVETAARRARYEFLEEAAGQGGARYVVTAHTADDQAETILHRIVRGTGIAGLAGIPRVRPLGPAVLIRPMLTVRRKDVLAYLDQIGQSFREDASNADRCFTRNRIRHELLPLLDLEYHAGAAEALLRLGALAGEAQAVIQRLVETIVDRVVETQGENRVSIDAQALSRESPFLIRETLSAVWRLQGWPLKAMGLGQWTRLAEMVIQSAGEDNPSRCDLPGGIVAIAASGSLRLERLP